MPRTTIAGHPAHPQLITLPAGLMPASLVLDVMHVATRKQSYADAAYYTLVGGSLGACAAAAAGAADWLAIPSRTPAKRIANLHAAMNVALLGMSAANVVLRRRSSGGPPAAAVLLSAVANAGLLVSAWYGGELVYEAGMRVRGVDPAGGSSEVPLMPGDSSAASALRRLQARMTGSGGAAGERDGEPLEPDRDEERLDELVDIESEDSFPASDPPSTTPVQGTGSPTEQA